MKGIRIMMVSLAAVMALWASSVASAEGPQPEHWLPRLSIVWPQDGQGHGTSVEQSHAVNLSIWPRNTVSCWERPASPNGSGLYDLLIAQDNEPAQWLPGTSLQSQSSLLLRTMNSVRVPSWEVSDIPLNLAVEPTARFRLVLMDRLGFQSNVWVHASDPRTLLPNPVLPTGYSAALPNSRPFDTRIQIVWPHNERGEYAPVERATRVNLAVDVFKHGTTRSLQRGWSDIGLRVAVAEGNGPVTVLDKAPDYVEYTLNGQTYPRWVFNDIPVQAGRQYHFLIHSHLGGTSKSASPYTTIWTHAADPRTLLPNPEPPPACVP